MVDYSGKHLVMAFHPPPITPGQLHCINSLGRNIVERFIVAWTERDIESRGRRSRFDASSSDSRLQSNHFECAVVECGDPTVAALRWRNSMEVVESQAVIPQRMGIQPFIVGATVVPGTHVGKLHNSTILAVWQIEGQE